MMTGDGWVTGVCAAVVAFYAMQRYNTPETNRSSTTTRLFFVSGAGYVAASLLLYALLTAVVLRPGALHVLGVQQVTELLAKYTAPPVLAAVVLTTLLPQVPVLKAADAFLLRRFQTLGRIPSGVGHLADGLALSKLVITGSDLEASRGWIAREPDVPNDLAARLAADSPDTPQGMWTALAVLHRGVEALGTDPAYKPFFKKHAPAWQALRADFRVFAAQSQAFFVLFDQLAPRASDEASNDALKQARACYLGIGEGVRAATAEALARALLAVEPSDAGVTRRLRRLGFAEEMAPPKPPVGAFVFLGVMLVLVLLALVRLFPPRGEWLPGPLVAVLIGSTQTCALLIAVWPKGRGAFFRRKPDGALPYLGWLSAAAAAGAVGFAVERGLLALVHRDWGAAVPSAAFPLFPNAFMAAGLALAIGILCDVSLGVGRWRRLAEGVLAGAAMVFCIGLCVGMLDLPSSTKEIAPVRWFPFALSFALGFTAGVTAPHLYRVAAAHRATAGDETPVDAATTAA